MNSGIVASPSALIPSRFSTFHAVMARIFRSSRKDRLSTYQTSRANFSSQVIAFRPLICAHPVIPGFTSCRRACSGVYRSRYWTRRGRGPTRLMSPFRTLNSSGSSSKLSRRRSMPKPESRASSGRRFPSRFRRSRIVRNFSSVNGLPPNPGRTWRKRTGDPSRKRTRKTMRRSTGESTTRPDKERNRSNICFPHRR